jgi:hypothetical protein
MSYDLVIQTEAISDIKEAFEWYEGKKEGLGYLLIKEIEISSTLPSVTGALYCF